MADKNMVVVESVRQALGTKLIELFHQTDRGMKSYFLFAVVLKQV